LCEFPLGRIVPGMFGLWFQSGSLLPRWRSDRVAVLSLVALAIALKLIVLLQHPILARDGIRHLHFAYDLAEKPWASTVREHPFHPGYAYTVLVASMIFDWCDPGPLTPSEWQWCGHLSSSLAGVLLVLPLFGLARCFFSLRTSWLACLFFLILPSVVQTTSDTLTESWYLLFALGSLWAMVHGVRSQRSSWFVLAGLLAGAGYLVRVEALILPASYVVWMFVRRWQTGQVLPSGASLRNLGLLGVCFVLPALPYMVTIGKLSNRPAVQTMAHIDSLPIAEPMHLLATQRLQDGVNGLRIDKVHWADATSLVAITHLRAGNYLLWPLAAVGCYLMWRTLRHDAGYLLLASLLVLHTAMLMRLALTAGYTSERHTLLAIVLVAQAAAVGFVGLKQWLKQHWHSQRRTVQALSSLVLLAGVCLSLPKAMQPLHHSQEGHRQAGLWLAQHLQTGDELVDPYTWASFYAGVAFKSKTPRNVEHNSLGIIDPRDNDLNRLRDWKEAGLLSEEATTTWAWPSAKQPKLLIKRKAHQGLGKTFTF
jgi:hypothetical protein